MAADLLGCADVLQLIKLAVVCLFMTLCPSLH